MAGVLFLCLNGYLWRVPVPINYFPSNQTVYVNGATYVGTVCQNEVFKSGFEAESGVQALPEKGSSQNTPSVEYQ